MTKDAVKRLVRELEGMYKYYHGWHFMMEYEGVLAYRQMGGNLTVYCTPDYSVEGSLSIQVVNQSDGGSEMLETEEIPYPEDLHLSPWAFFKIVKPFLDRHMAT